MCENEASTPHLLACKQLERTNHATTAPIIDSAIRILWLNEEDDCRERVLLLITDTASYMLGWQRLKNILFKTAATNMFATWNK